MQNYQTGILSELPSTARFLIFSLSNADELNRCLNELLELVDGDNIVCGFGQSLVQTLNAEVPGLRTAPAISHRGLDIPSTPAALWCWLRAGDRGELYHQSRLLLSMLTPVFALEDCIDSYTFDSNRDLSGYEDGTENPQGDEATRAAFVAADRGSGLSGSSFVAVQKWCHDFDKFDSMNGAQQDDCIGRHVSDNSEYDEAPESAHVKRSAQESFSPEAFVLRRSMPWSEGLTGGLNFIAFGHSFDAFEAILERMCGIEDGIVDGLFQFTRPLTSSYFWCPPMRDGRMDLSALNR